LIKSIVIYFSQTGNTKKIAEAVHAGMSELSERCDIARLQDLTAGDLIHYDLIGLGSPVWHRREPANVLSFIEYTMNSMEGKHSFTFCTHGIFPGHFLGRVVPALTLEGLTVIGWKNWYCSVWMPEKPKPYFTDGHPDEIDLNEAKIFGREMVERSRRVSAGESQLIPKLPRGREYHELYPGPGSTDRINLGPPAGPGSTEMKQLIDLRSFDFKVNTKRCLYPKCTICIDHCPTHSINFAIAPPVFRKNCDRCWFCEQICPRGAIEVDWEPIARFMDQYIIDDWFRVAEEAVAKGRFRRLVQPKDIGRNTYWYSVKKPPRLKVL
jgi:ferredoxin